MIDPRQLLSETRQNLSNAYDELSKTEIQALPQMAKDDIREKIDAAVTVAFGFKRDLSLLRKLLAAEPIISMKPYRVAMSLRKVLE